PSGDRDRLTAPLPEAAASPPPGADLARVVVTLDDPWGAAADALVKKLHDLTLEGWAGFWLTGPADRHHLLTRLDLGERLRAETAGLVVVDGPSSSLDDL